MAEINTNPNLDYQWASQSLTVEPNNTANKTEPLSRMKTEGWQWKEKPSFSRLNMWMYRVFTQLDWASESIDTLASLLDFVVEVDTTYYVSTAGDDTTGDGSQASPWATPTKAYDFMSSRLVPNSVSVTISVAAGTYSFTEPLDISHPSGDRIFLVGADLSGNKPYDMQIGDYSVDRNSPTIPTQGADEFFNTAGTLGADAVAGTRTTARSTDRSNNESLLRARYSTILDFTGCSGIITESGTGNINKVLVIGNRTTGTQGLSCGGDPEQFDTGTITYGGHITCGTEVAVHGFFWGVVANVNSSIQCHYITVTGCSGTGLIAQYGGALVGQGMTIQGNDFSGIQVGNGGSMVILGCKSSGNAQQGIVAYGSANTQATATYPNGSIWSGNGRHGIRAIGSGWVLGNGTVSGNGGYGIVSEKSGNVSWDSSTVVGNDDSGCLTLNSGGNIGVSSSSVENNGAGALVSLGAGTITAISATITTGNGTWTPDANGTNNGTAAHIYAEGAGSINIQNAGSGNTGVGVLVNPAYGSVGNGNAYVGYTVSVDLNTG